MKQDAQIKHVVLIEIWGEISCLSRSGKPPFYAEGSYRSSRFQSPRCAAATEELFRTTVPVRVLRSM